MEESVKTIQCSNITCLVFNPCDNQFCHQCGTPIVRRYLYVLDEEIKSLSRGELINDRYLIEEAGIILDTKPGLAPELIEDLPPQIIPYLKLIPYQLHIPPVYGFTTVNEREIWLLEYFTSTTKQALPERPKLTEVWSQGTDFQQLHWLWQIASLWQPFYEENVAATLLDPSLIRVEGSLIKIKQLQLIDKQKTPLKLLGHLWSTLVKTAATNIKNLIETTAQAIIKYQIIHSQQILEILDQAIAECSKNKEYRYQICSYSDVGKMRENNEDSCYPASGVELKIEPKEHAFAIVCDGIGGHEGGEVASQMTIDFLKEEVPKIGLSEDKLTPETIQEQLQQLTCDINDIVSNRNNSEERFQQRQRMGTTLVMTFSNQHEMYCTHVGDSRIYRITKHNCQQLTVDDDLASRQVRLGYTLYRDAILYPGAGALVQALGMNPSLSLHPTTQRYLIGEDSVFLLCSDGLSDFDRVEQYWEQEILPIFTQEKNLAEVGKRLIEIANQTNGHDNITIALVYCQILPKSDTEEIICNWEDLISSIENLPIQDHELSFSLEENFEEKIIREATITTIKTQQFSSPRKKTPTLNIDVFLIIFIILGSVYLIYAWLIEPLLKNVFKPEIKLVTGQIIKTKENTILYSLPSQEQNPDNLDGIAQIPAGSIMQVIFDEDHNNENWLLFKVCSSSETELETLPQGYEGWQKTELISNIIKSDFQPSQTEETECNNVQEK
jgi:protein phosphatase